MSDCLHLAWRGSNFSSCDYLFAFLRTMQCCVHRATVMQSWRRSANISAAIAFAIVVTYKQGLCFFFLPDLPIVECFCVSFNVFLQVLLLAEAFQIWCGHHRGRHFCLFCSIWRSRMVLGFGRTSVSIYRMSE